MSRYAYHTYIYVKHISECPLGLYLCLLHPKVIEKLLRKCWIYMSRYAYHTYIYVKHISECPPGVISLPTPPKGNWEAVRVVLDLYE